MQSLAQLRFLPRITGNISRYSAQFSRHASFEVGDKRTLSKTFSLEEVRLFGEIGLDNNPIHIDPDFAKTTRFGKPVVHGILHTALLSALIGTKIPGFGTIVIDHNMEFLAPLLVDEEVTADAEIIKKEGRIYTIQMTCSGADGKVLSKGVSKLLGPKQ